MNADDIYSEMARIAEENGYELTPTAYKVATFMAKRGISTGVCPCHPDIPAPYRGCIGMICADEIKNKGVCCCNVFKSCK